MADISVSADMGHAYIAIGHKKSYRSISKYFNQYLALYWNLKVFNSLVNQYFYFPCIDGFLSNAELSIFFYCVKRKIKFLHLYKTFGDALDNLYLFFKSWLKNLMGGQKIFNLQYKLFFFIFVCEGGQK